VREAPLMTHDSPHRSRGTPGERDNHKLLLLSRLMEMNGLPLLGEYAVSAAVSSRSPPHAQRPTLHERQGRRRWWQLRRRAGWYLFLIAVLSLQAVAVLVVAGGLATLRAPYLDVLLHLHPWGVASCVCGAGISVVSLAIVLCLR
jgi:hypothetical protein